MDSHEALEIGMIDAHAQYDISPSFSTPLDHGDITERRFEKVRRSNQIVKQNASGQAMQLTFTGI